MLNDPGLMLLNLSCQFLGYARGRFPVAEQLAQQVLSLPVYPEMTDAMVERVVEKVKELISM